MALITGYLGAGKTTLVNHLLRQANGRRIAVLVNDFGELSIDAELIAASQPDPQACGIIALAGGCLCCSFGDDLPGTLAQLAARPQPPQHILIECSGVAVPQAVWRSLRLSPLPVRGITVTVVDASALTQQLANRYIGETVRQQLADAQLLLINRTQGPSAAEQRRQARGLQRLAPSARSLSGPLHALPAELVLDWPEAELAAPGPDDPVASAARWAARPLQPAGAAPHPQLSSWREVLAADADLPALARRLAADPAVLRAKAIWADAQGGRWALQVTPGQAAVDRLPGPAAAAGGLLIGIRLAGAGPSRRPRVGRSVGADPALGRRDGP